MDRDGIVPDTSHAGGSCPSARERVACRLLREGFTVGDIGTLQTNVRRWLGPSASTLIAYKVLSRNL
jgi:hypothetical protein